MTSLWQLKRFEARISLFKSLVCPLALAAAGMNQRFTRYPPVINHNLGWCNWDASTLMCHFNVKLPNVSDWSNSFNNWISKTLTLGMHIIMTSSNGNIFRVTGPLWRESHRSPVDSPNKGQWRRPLMFLCCYISLKKRLNKHSIGRLLETPWVSFNVAVILLFASSLCWC